MSLNNSCDFRIFSIFNIIMRIWGFSSISIRWYKYHSSWHHLPINFLLICDNHLSIIRAIMVWIFAWWSTSINLAIFRFTTFLIWFTSRTRSLSYGWIPLWIIGNSIYLEISEEKYVLIVLFQHYLKHKGIKFFFFLFILIVSNVERLNKINCIEW